MARRKSTPLRSTMSRLFPRPKLERLARETGAVQRRRVVDVVALFWTLMLTLETRSNRSIADLRRSYAKVTGDAQKVLWFRLGDDGKLALAGQVAGKGVGGTLHATTDAILQMSPDGKFLYCISADDHAVATIARADVIVSWNFRHMVDFDRIRKFNRVNAMEGYPAIEIRSPLEMGHGSEDEDV